MNSPEATRMDNKEETGTAPTEARRRRDRLFCQTTPRALMNSTRNDEPAFRSPVGPGALLLLDDSDRDDELSSVNAPRQEDGKADNADWGTPSCRFLCSTSFLASFFCRCLRLLICALFSRLFTCSIVC